MKNKINAAAFVMALLAIEVNAVRSQDADETQAEAASTGHSLVLFESDSPIVELTIDTTPVMQMAKGRELLPNDTANEILKARVSSSDERIWAMTGFHWTAPNVFHRPLYFEQVNLERYGHYRKNWHVQSAISSAHFFATVPALPIKALLYRPCEPVYTLGHHRPGNCNPNQRHAYR